MDTMAIIMAAGEGTRMKSDVPKVLHQAAGRSLINWVIDSVSSVSTHKPIIIVGSGAEKVRQHLGEEVLYAEQLERLGTGHAVMMAKDFLTGKIGYVLVTAGDMPLMRQKSIEALFEKAIANNCAASMLTAVVDDATGYGRVVRDKQGKVSRIVEHRDANQDELNIKEINASVYCFNIAALVEALNNISNANDQSEYYLTDCIGYLVSKGENVEAMVVEDESECLGINDRAQLSYAENILQKRIAKKHMLNGVTMINPDSIHIEYNVEIGRDCVVYPNNYFQAGTKIGRRCTIYSGCRMKNCVIGDDTTIESSVLTDCKVGEKVTIGPFAHIRPKTDISNMVRIGNFVEVKNTKVGLGSKISHLTYAGDGEIGDGCNVGCGVVFVNYDGTSKNKTVVKDGAFIGCNTNLVAPVTVGKNAYTAAGSTITHDVPENGLGVAREKQRNIEGWVDKRRTEKK